MYKLFLLSLFILVGCSNRVPCDYNRGDIVIILTEPWFNHKGEVVVIGSGMAKYDVGVALLNDKGKYSGTAMSIPCSMVKPNE